jgi:hypothetical protein
MLFAWLCLCCEFDWMSFSKKHLIWLIWCFIISDIMIFYLSCVKSTNLKIRQRSSFTCTLKTKIQVQFRNDAKDVLFLWSKMFFIWNNVLFQEQIMICAWKSNIFDTFSVLDLSPNEKKNTIYKSVAFKFV